MSLITPHTDQVLFPLLCTISLLLLSLSYRKGSTWLALATGLAVCMSLYFSFALAFVLPFGICLGLGWTLQERSRNGWARFLKASLAVGIGLIGADLVFRLALNHDFLLRYQHPMAHHTAWKG